MSVNTSHEQARRKVPLWVIGAGVGAAISVLVALGLSDSRELSQASLISQAQELSAQHSSRLGCDLAKDRRIIDAQYGTIGYDHQGLVRTAALENRAPAVHAVIAVTCVNRTAETEGEIYQQVIVGMDRDADESPCRGIESITKYDANKHHATGYEVDVNFLGGTNSVATLRGVCDFQKS
jgi:hypothetical protein